MGHQNKLLVSRGVPPDRTNEEIGFTTSAHGLGHSRTVVGRGERSRERYDRVEDEGTNTHMKEGAKFHFPHRRAQGFIYTSGMPIKDALFVIVTKG